MEGFCDCRFYTDYSDLFMEELCWVDVSVLQMAVSETFVLSLATDASISETADNAG